MRRPLASCFRSTRDSVERLATFMLVGSEGYDLSGRTPEIRFHEYPRFFLDLQTMNKTTVVLAFFVAALLAGWFLRSMAVPPAAKASGEDTQTAKKETFMQREVGMPLDMQAGGVQGFEGTSPLLGSEPKPVPLQPYDMANDQELFQFDGNKVSADCCPSPFSTDRGCVCLTDKQIQEFASRGGNRA